MINIFLELFQPIQKGDFGLTDEAIYCSLQHEGELIPVWGAYKEHIYPDRYIPTNGKTKYNEPITIFDGEGIIINFDGVSAGRMTYKKNERFALNHHTGFFKVREQEKKIDMKLFSLFYQNQLQDASVSSDQNTLTIDTIYSVEFDVPDYTVQQEIMKKIHPLLDLKQKINTTLKKINLIEERVLLTKYNNYQAKGIVISEIINYMGGNSGLTEKFIYEKSQTHGQKYLILSGANPEENEHKKIVNCSIEGKPLKVFEDKDGILVIRKGEAGKTFYLKPDKYSSTDDAYILFLKDDCKYQISLKWLMYQYRESFLEYASSSDNGTWNMTGFFQNVIIDIPSIEEQRNVVKEYEKLEKLEKILNNAIIRINNIFTKRII